MKATWLERSNDLGAIAITEIEQVRFPMPTAVLSTLLLFLPAAACGGADEIPPSIVHLYEEQTDANVSDEFDGPDLDADKWDYRTGPAAANWLKSNVSIEKDDACSYLDLRGEWKRSIGPDGAVTGTGTSSGVYSRNTAGRGFYTTRWRVTGMRPDKKSTWHPAIWCHRCIPILADPSRLPIDHIELDFIEFSQSRTLNVQWHSQAVEWVRGADGGNQMTPIETKGYNSDFQEAVWSTHGLEYHTNYVRLWSYDEDSQQWSPSGEAITISKSPTDKESLNIDNASAHEQAYWILSNYDFFDRTNEMWEPYHGRPIKATDNFLMSDSALQIDYFRYRPLK